MLLGFGTIEKMQLVGLENWLSTVYLDFNICFILSVIWCRGLPNCLTYEALGSRQSGDTDPLMIASGRAFRVK